ncbi:MAG: tRNA adenosine(34) deaminase TadA [Desulfobacterota bacterium]|nr:tRNA adenosine(34) deaminase TadA [Thermodesulfobacteriota bacterium]
MRLALDEARQARLRNEVPIGAVVVLHGEVIGRGHNSSITLHDPSAHAEIQALRSAGEYLGNYRLVGSTLYVTIEPCMMCIGAIVQARVRRLVYGADDPRAGAAGSVFDFCADHRLNHRIVVRRGVCADACSSLLRDFFAGQRQRRDGRAG